LTGSELGQIDVGSWFNRQYPAAAKEEYERETIPTLKQLFQALAHSDCLLYLEMKSDEVHANDLAVAVVDLIRDFDFKERVIVESFDLPALAIVKGLDPTIRLAPLFEPTFRRGLSALSGSRMVDLARGLGANEIALHRRLIRPGVVARATSYSLPIVAWTIDDPGWIRRARALGLKGLITNDPYKMLKARDLLTQ
jgi:glycerophosphoryl diester phosphodiesterase